MRRNGQPALRGRQPIAAKQTLRIEGVCVEVIRKPIKHMYLRVKRPDGHVQVSAPKRMSETHIRRFLSERRDWIRRQQSNLQGHVGARARFIDGERHPVWGKACVLRLLEGPGRAFVAHREQVLHMRVPPGADAVFCKKLLDAWYNEQLRAELPPLLDTWQPRLGVAARRISVRRMKSRWGSCTPHTGDIRLNTSLAQWPIACLEYVLVHELVHLLEASHNHRFRALMDMHLPAWRHYRRMLNHGSAAEP